MVKITIIAFFCLAIASCGRDDSATPPTVEEYMHDFATGQSRELYLSKYSGFAWDQVSLITPYQDVAKVAADCKVSGISSGGPIGMGRDDTHGIESRDDIVVLVFSNSGDFVTSLPIRRRPADFAEIRQVCIPRERANFRLTDGGAVEILSE